MLNVTSSNIFLYNTQITNQFKNLTMSLLKAKSLPYSRKNVVKSLCTKKWRIGLGLPEDGDIRPLSIGNGTIYIQGGILGNVMEYAEENMLRVTVYFKNPFITR